MSNDVTDFIRHLRSTILDYFLKKSKVASKLNVVRTVSLPILTRRNICFSVDAGKQLTGPKQAIKMGDCVIEEVVSTRCLGVQINNAPKWGHHELETTKSLRRS